MTPAALRDLIIRARAEARHPGPCAPYVLALAELSKLAEERLLAGDALASATDRDRQRSFRRYQDANRSLREVLDLPRGGALALVDAPSWYARIWRRLRGGQ